MSNQRSGNFCDALGPNAGVVQTGAWEPPRHTAAFAAVHDASVSFFSSMADMCVLSTLITARQLVAPQYLDPCMAFLMNGCRPLAQLAPRPGPNDWLLKIAFADQVIRSRAPLLGSAWWHMQGMRLSKNLSISARGSVPADTMGGSVASNFPSLV